MSYLAERILENKVLDLVLLHCRWRHDLLNDLIECMVVDKAILDIIDTQIKNRKVVAWRAETRFLLQVHSLIILVVSLHLLQKYFTIESLRNTIQDLVNRIVNI